MLGHRNYFLFFALCLLSLAAALAFSPADPAVQAALYARPLWLLPLMKALTFLGSWFALIPVLLIGLAAAYRQLQGQVGLRIAVATFTALAVVETLKLAVSRARPTVTHLASSNGGSFPSGHSLDSVVVYGLVGLALLRLAPRARRLALVLFAVPALVGWSRVFVGVHWPSDVVGGWGIGLLIFSLAAGQCVDEARRDTAAPPPRAIESQRASSHARLPESGAIGVRKRA